LSKKSSQKGRIWPVLCLVAALALVLRLVYLFELRDAAFFDLRMGDGFVYHEWARRIAAGDWLGDGVFYQAPLYPYSLAIIYRLLGEGLMTVRVVQALMGTASCVLLAHAGGALFGRRGALTAGAGMAIYAPAIFLDSLVQKSALATLLATALIALICARSGRNPGSRWWAIGALLGLLALTRENALVFAGVALLWALFGERGSGSSPQLRRAGGLALGLAMVLFPVAARSLAMAGEVHLTTSQLGPNLYIGNNPEADGSYRPLSFGRGDARRERDDATALAERAEGRSLSPGEVSRYWLDQALGYARDQPLDWIALLARKAALTVNAREMVDSEAQEVFADESRVLRWLGVLHFGVLFPLAVYGLVLQWRLWRRLWVLPLMTLAYAGSVTVFYVFARYRFPLVPTLLLFAAGGVVGTIERVRRSRPRRLAPAAAVAAVATLLANLPLYSPLHSRAVHYFNIGTKLLELPQRQSEAVEYFERSLTAAPAYPEARFGLAAALAATGQTEQAVARYLEVIELQPEFAEARYGLGLALARLGRYDEALREYRATLELRPEHLEALVASGSALSELGRQGLAAEQHRRALERAPDHVEARVGLGLALARLNRLDAAIGQFERAIAVNPAHAVAYNNLGSVLAMQGRFAAAVDSFARAVELDPAYADARRNLQQARRVLASAPGER